MEKKIAAVFGGTNAQVGELKVNRLLPNRYIQAVGPFVFLDHLYPFQQASKTPSPKNGKHAHPHRGIATFSYLFSGELEHYDSMGNYGIVKAGGAQWMKAGNGIIHDEAMSPEFQQRGGVLHALQFWVNLPAKNKAEDPKYLAVQPEDIPEADLNGSGTLRVLIGSYNDKVSPVETYTEQFAYHIRLKEKSGFTLNAKAGLEYAAFVPQSEVVINNQPVQDSEIVVFSDEGTDLHFENRGNAASDFIVFGGAPYEETIVAEGPFVMNSRGEIADAYSAFFNGSYGIINYQK